MGATKATSTKKSAKAKTNSAKSHKKKQKGGSYFVGIVCIAVLLIMIGTVVLFFVWGKNYYKDKFLANTQINGVNVGSKTYEEAVQAVMGKTVPDKLKIHTIDNKEIDIDTKDFGYSSNVGEEIKKAYENVNHTTWFTGMFAGDEYNFTETFSFDKKKLSALLRKADWGNTPGKDASIKLENGEYIIHEEETGNKIANMNKLVSAVTAEVEKGNFNIALNEETGCYRKPKVTAESLAVKCDNLNKIRDIEIGYDFTYTVEKLSGEKLLSLLDINEDGTYTPNRDKCMKYVEYLAKKYDTYNTKRKFHATLQGNIIVPTSSDARYGWWIDQEQTCDQLVDLISQGKSVKKVEPIYYEDGGFKYTGLKSARTKNGDIGKTYVEIDLTAQHLWVYKKGKKTFECDIVSGQTTSEARTTLPGVYKLWQKATNYRMKDTNADGDSWDTTCNYWNRVAIVGIGLHDSTWRGNAFGGNIYTYNGSHGCINMPYEGAKYIYEHVPMGVPVVMYYKSAKK